MEKSLSEIINKLKDYTKNPEKLQRYNSLITRLNIGLERLENDISNMSENDVENKKLDYLKDLVKTIVDDMPPLETEEDAEKGKGKQQEVV